MATGPSSAPANEAGAQWGRLADQTQHIAQNIDGIARQLAHISQQVEPPHGFFNEMHAPDYIQAALLLVAIAALLFTRGSLVEASKGRDVENYYKIVGLFEGAFDRFANADLTVKYIEFLALMNLFESTCHLYNGKLFGRATKQMLRNYLRQMLPQIWQEPVAHNWIETAVKKDLDTFKEIRVFARSEKLKGIPYPE